MNRRAVLGMVLGGFLCCGVAESARVDKELAGKVRVSIDDGVAFLLTKQGEDGAWLHDPAMTSLCSIALHQSGSVKHAEEAKNAVDRGRRFILKFVKDNGSIVADESQYVNYTTAIALSALAIIGDPADKETMRGARHFLIDSQLDQDNAENPTSPKDPFFGGIGYGSGGPKCPDLSNTQLALEALYLTEHLDRDTPYAGKSKLCWKNAIQFLQSVQNVPKDAGTTWIVNVEDDPENDGGFIYRPDESKATGKLEAQGEDAEGLRSYGSMTYAGLKSMVYAQLEKDDVRVKAARDWASRHYTLDENPGMGPEGHYYYLQTFAKALNAFGEDTLVTADGRTCKWREDLLRKLIALQKDSGEWHNDKHGRWMESIPELVTAYSLIAMEVALGD